jgi:hypothetical protein
MTLSDVLATKQLFTTQCCKAVYVTLGVSSVYQKASSLNAVSINVEDIPTQQLYLSLSVTNINGRISTTTGLIPSILGLQNQQSTFVSIGSDSTQRTGVSTITVAIINGTGYEVVYRNPDRSFTVLGSKQAPPVPNIVSAVFSSDGSFIRVLFDFPTDRGGSTTAASFRCNNMFTFMGSAEASCKWASFTEIVIYLSPQSSIVPSSVLQLQSDKVKALCTLSDCTSWSYVNSKTITITAPVDAVIPIGM